MVNFFGHVHPFFHRHNLRCLFSVFLCSWFFMSNMTQFEKLCFHFKPLKICFCFLIPGKHKRLCGEKKKLSNFRNSGWSRKVAWTDYFNLERKLIIDLRHTPKFWNSWHFQCVLEKLRSIVQHAKSKLGFLRKNFLVSQTYRQSPYFLPAI